MKHPRLNPTPLAAAVRRAAGFTLVETLLGLGVATAIGAVAFVAYNVTSVKADVRGETEAMEQSAQRIERSIGIVGNYASVSSGIVRRDDLGGDRHKRAGGSELVNAWGEPLAFLPATVGNGPGNNAFIIQQRVPERACVPLVSAMATRAFDVRVDGVSVLDGEGGSLDVAAAGAACSGNTGPLQFVFYSGISGGSFVAAPPLVLPTAPPAVSPPTSAPVGGPVGPVGPVGPAGPVGPVAPAPVAPTPAPITPPPSSGTPVAPVTPGPVAPPPASVSPPTSPVAACVAPASRTTTEGQTRAICPAGQYGQVTEQRVGTYSYSCPEAWDRPVEAFSWAGWTVTSNTCTTCPGVQPQQQTQWVATGQGCPAGQEGSHTWEAEQIQTRTGSYNCPAGTATLPGINWAPWGGWTNTGNRRNESNSCAPSAPAFEIKATCSFTGAQTNEGPEKWNGGCIQPGQFYMRTSPVSAVFWLTSSVDLSQYAIQWSGDCVGNATSCTAEQVRVSVNSPHDKTATVTVTHRATGQQFSRTVTAQWRVQGIDKGGGGN